MIKCELYNDNFQNWKSYPIKKAQLVIADLPYQLGVNAYASNPQWYKDGDNKNGESEYAGKAFFKTELTFHIPEYMHFCNNLLIKEPKETGKSPAMICFCAFEQIPYLVAEAEKYGFKHSYPLVFIKNFSAQVLKANMKIVGATEYAMVFIEINCQNLTITVKWFLTGLIGKKTVRRYQRYTQHKNLLNCLKNSLRYLRT